MADWSDSERIGELLRVRDSGLRRTGAGGMLKDAEDKADPTLIDRPFLWRIARHMTLGAMKYERDNWRKACTQEELDGFRASAFRHLLQWLDGMGDEDHAAAVVANLMMAEDLRGRLEGIQPARLEAQA